MASEISLILQNTVDTIAATTADTSLGGRRGTSFTHFDRAGATPDVLRALESPARHFLVDVDQGMTFGPPMGQVAAWTSITRSLSITIVYPRSSASHLALAKIMVEDADRLAYQLARPDLYAPDGSTLPPVQGTKLVRRMVDGCDIDIVPSDGNPTTSISVSITYRPTWS